MPSATLTSKGQITIPAAVRAAMRLHAGTKIEFVETAPRQYTIMAKTGSVRDLQGIVPKPDKIATIDDMNHAIAEHAKDLHDRA